LKLIYHKCCCFSIKILKNEKISLKYGLIYEKNFAIISIEKYSIIEWNISIYIFFVNVKINEHRHLKYNQKMSAPYGVKMKMEDGLVVCEW